PLTGKDSVREQPDAFVRRKSHPYLRAQTTGTTGRPTSIAFSSQELRVYCALQAISHLLSGDIQADDVVLVSTSGRGVLGNLCLAGACAHVGAIVTMGGLIDPAATLARLAEKQSLPGKRDRVSVLYTYPSYLGELVECGLRLGYRPQDFGLRLIAAGGEIVTEGLRRRSRELFGEVRYTEGYGMTEIWPFGGQMCEQGHLHFEAVQGLLEIVDPATSETTASGAVGAIVATPFPPFRETTLLLRYNTEDMVQRLAEPPTCSLHTAPATGPLLGKRRLAVHHDQGWTYPRPVLEALESLPEVPLPARCGFWAGPGGVAVEVMVKMQAAAVRRKVAGVLEEQGVPLCELYLVEQARDLCHPLPLRGDLREPELTVLRPPAACMPHIAPITHAAGV
ncbi:MAG: AMP-binding protein, partial [Caldilineaceae bacterium]